MKDYLSCGKTAHILIQ